jgi:ATP-dependent Zn protease
MITVVDNAVVDDLAKKTDGRLSAVLVHIRHVQIVHEVDKDLVGRGTKGLTGSLVDV